MSHFCRTILIALVWFSLLIVPYLFISYLCYAGLCGGGEAEEVRSNLYYLAIIKYSAWLYPLIAFYALYQSHKLKQLSQPSTAILLLPVFCLLPVAYVLIQVHFIHNKYIQQQESYYSVHPDDFVCSRGTFIRYNPSDPGRFYFFEGKPGAYGTSWSVSYFYSYDEVIAYLKNNNIDKALCKNNKGNGLTALQKINPP